MIDFNGLYTISSPKGGHRTFRVAQGSGKLEDKRILSLLVGSDNSSDYEGFAFLKDDGVSVWSRFVKGQGTYRTRFSVRVWNAAWTAHQKMAHMLWNLVSSTGDAQQYLDMGYTVSESRECFRCGRTLTTPESIEKGIGPVCEAKL